LRYEIPPPRNEPDGSDCASDFIDLGAARSLVNFETEGTSRVHSQVGEIRVAAKQMVAMRW